MTRRRWLLPIALIASLAAAASPRTGPTNAHTRTPEAAPGTPAPPQVVAEIQAALGDALHRFEAMDAPGLLTHVSDRYRTGPLTKNGLAEQLRAMFAVNDQVTARVRIDAVRMVGEQAWIYSTGDVTGRVRWIGSTVPVLAWQHELEIARRENGRWRLFGYQQ